MKFGEALREIRRNAGLSQRDLAERASLDFSYISKLENDRIPPPAADTVVRMCNVLGVPSDQLLSLVGKIPSDVQETVSGSQAAQQFLRQAQLAQLTDAEWVELTRHLQHLREE